MIEHPQDEKIIAGYDPELIRRLAAFARPYRWLIAGALLSLLIATIGEVLVPVMIQRTVDHEILDYWVAVDRQDIARFGEVDRQIDTGDTVYLREEVLDRITRADREELSEAGRLDTSRHVVIPQEVLGDEAELARRLAPELVDQTEALSVYPRAVLDNFSEEERLRLRRANIAGLRRNVLVFLAILGSVLIASFGQVYLTAFTGQLVMKDLRLRIFDHTIRQDLGFLSNQPVGRLVTRVTNDVETINELFTSVLAELTRNISLMIAVVITMVSLNARLAGIVIISMLPIILVTDLFRRHARTAFRRVRLAVSRVNAYLSEYISGMSVVQLFVQQDRSRHEFGERNGSLLGAHLSEMRIFAVFRPIVDFMSSTSTAVLIYFGARLLEMELVSLGVLIAFTNLIRRFYMPVMSISEQFTVLQSAMAGAERVFSLLDEDHRIDDSGTLALEPATVAGRIAFEDVHFGYKPDEPVLKGISFEAEPGQMLAVVGYTGAGKTTIINLLTRLWDIDSGSIRLDGTDIRSLSLGSLRSSVQQIQQDVHLFNDTIRANIALGAAVGDQRIVDACRAVQLQDYIDQLPAGLDTMVQERGANLSAGQRQLISFARALVHDPPVLVLDEATSSIDSETEQRLQHAVETVTGGRTSLVIAHRLSTIQHADRIIVLSHGEMVETGSHQELLQQKGLYATLYRLQYERQDKHRG